MLEVLPGAPMQLLASWFVFAPDGGQAWIVGLGAINGNHAVVQGMQTLGAGWTISAEFRCSKCSSSALGHTKLHIQRLRPRSC